MGALTSAEDGHGTAAESAAQPLTTETRLHRLEIQALRGEAVMQDLQFLQKRMDRLEQSQGELRQVHETILLRMWGDWDIPAAEDADEEDYPMDRVWDQLNLLWAAKHQLGSELVKVHRQETHYVAQYAILNRRLQRLEAAFPPNPVGGDGTQSTHSTGASSQR